MVPGVPKSADVPEALKRRSRGRARLAGDVAVVLLALYVELLILGPDREMRHVPVLPSWVLPVVVCAVFSTLLLRWRHPLAIFGLQWSFAVAIAAEMPAYGSFAGVLVALHAVARRCPRRAAWAALAAVSIPFAGNSANAAAGSPVTAAEQLVLWSALTLTIWGLGRLAFHSEHRAQEAQREKAVQAVRDERLRLARELHDSVASAVGAMQWQASGALSSGRDDDVRRSLRLIEDIARQASIELQHMLGLLREVDRDDAVLPTQAGPTLKDLPSLLDRARDSGLAVRSETTGRPSRLAPEVDLAAYRLVQEALTNSAKHCAADAAVLITLDWEADRLAVAVRDAPVHEMSARRGDAVPSSGLGLLGLRERVASAGGEFDAGPVGDGAGFAVRATLPVVADSRSPAPPL